MSYMRDLTGRRLDSIKVPSAAEVIGPLGSVPLIPPAGLLWDWTNYPFTVSLVHLPDGRSVAEVSKKASDFFDAKSTARTAPATTYYVNGTTAQTVAGIAFGVGNDANAGTSSAAPLRGINTAYTKGNATGQPFRVITASGDYNRTFQTSVAPTSDCALLAAGVVRTGPWDDYNYSAAPSYNPGSGALTLANSYKTTTTVANAVLVAALDMRTDDGHYVELVQVATPMLVDVTPGSYCIGVDNFLYVQHPKRTAVSANTIRVYRSVSSAFPISNSVNVYIGGVDAGGSFHFEGGINAGINANIIAGAVPTSDRVLAISGGSVRYTGGTTTTGAVAGTGRGISGNGWRGLIVMENFDGSANTSDGLNWHNAGSDGVTTFSPARSCRVLEINCSATNNGRGPSQSNQSSTGHEDVVVISLGGRYVRGHGGTVRDIGNSQRWAAGCEFADDLGDRVYGGTMSPTAVQNDDDAETWLDRCLIRMPSGSRGLVATGNAKIHKRACWPTPQPDYAQAGATIDAY